MSLVNAEGGGELVGFPRVSGDEPTSRAPPRRDHRFSPRERG